MLQVLVGAHLPVRAEECFCYFDHHICTSEAELSRSLKHKMSFSLINNHCSRFNNLSVFQGGLPVSETVLSKGDRQAAAQRADRQFGERDRPAQVRISESIQTEQKLQNFIQNLLVFLQCHRETS